MRTTVKRSMLNPSPVAIGGVGGSGTRVVAELVERMGYFLGDTLNRASDNLDFVKSRQLLQIEDVSERECRIAEELHAFESRMHRAFERHGRAYRDWGWKVPGQFHLLPHTAAFFPGLRYVHVIRHGLDMAFSGNRNQLRNWGHVFGIEPASEDDPAAALDYWIRSNRHAIASGRELLGARFHLLSFDTLCASPETVIDELAAFVGHEHPDEGSRRRLAELVTTPASLGRHREHDIAALFDPAALRAVRELGFDVAA